MNIDPYYQQQTCSPMSLVSGGIRLTRIFVEVPWGGDVKRQWGCRERQFSAFSLAIFSETLEMSPALLYSDAQSVVSFSVIPKGMTLNYLERLFRVKFCFPAGLAGSDQATFELSKNNCVKTNKDRYIMSQRKSSAGSLLSGNIRFVRIFVRFL